MKLCILILLPVVLTSAQNSYIVTVPKVIRPGSVANVCVHILKRGGYVTIHASLLNYNEDQIYSSATRRVRPFRLQVVTLKVPLSLESGYNYKIRVTGSGSTPFKKTAMRIRVTDKATSLFIQTDRPVYKPGDLVRFRTFGTFPSLKYVEEPLDIFIYDPKRNRIQQHLNVTPAYGVFAGDLQLSSLTTYGTWNIEVKQLRENIIESFEVEKYVLPKFEVQIIVASMQLTTAEFFTFGVSAKYTFGKPVMGDVNVTLGHSWSSSTIKKRFKINGTAKISILMSEIKSILGSYVPIFVEVTETITGKKANDSSQSSLYSYYEKLTFSQSQPSVFKPGLEYTYILRLTDSEDQPLQNITGDVNITIYYTVYQDLSMKPALNEIQEERRFQPRCPLRPPSENKFLVSKLLSVPENGVIVDKVLFPKDAITARIHAYYFRASSSFYLERAGSAGGHFIQIRIRNKVKAQSDKRLKLVLKGTEKVHLCFYKIFSKDALVNQGRFTHCLSEAKSIIKDIKISTDMAPEAVLLLYYVRRDGEIVADSLTFPVDGIFKNKVDIKFNKRRVQPAEKVKLRITAAPNSLVSVVSVDKSILLLKTPNDITNDKVLTELQKYSTTFSGRFEGWDKGWSRPNSAKDSFGVFDTSGVYVLTDANLYQHAELPTGGWRVTRMSSTIPSSAMATFPMLMTSRSPVAESDDNVNSETTTIDTSPRIRTNFPETWLWTNATTSRFGTVSMDLTAPDTITEWITSAFALHPQSGLGVAVNSANLVSFQRFFIRLELPYSAIRGEILILQATLFNYMDTGFQVTVKLNASESFEFLDNDGNTIAPLNGGLTKSVFVEHDGVQAVYFPIITTAVGKIKIQVSANSIIIADAIERELLIEAEGIKQNYNLPILLDLRDQDLFMASLTIDFPPNVVKDSKFIKVSLIGDLMAQTLTGLEKLLSMSYGCGEQNMLRFSPNVYVSSYLSATNKITDEIASNIDKFLKSGYQRQLTYMRRDGSFSAFGNNDRSGSTWLTSFVVRSFAQAAALTYIDQNVMERSITFLLNQQVGESGEFKENGDVHHKEMQGGSTSSRKSLAAFVLISLLESQSNGQVPLRLQDKVKTAVAMTSKYISDDSPSSLSSLYELIIILYALSLANNPLAYDFLTAVEAKATISDGEKYWTLPETEANKIQPWRTWSPPRTSTRAVDVEMTSYMLLVYNLRKDVLSGIKVLAWLGNQRNSNGGFVSTQDTVVALQALAGISSHLYSPTFGLDVHVRSDQWYRNFIVNNQNSLVLQNEDAPINIKTLDIVAQGTGTCVLQASVYYNVPDEMRDPAFELSVSVLNDSIKGFRLRVCFRWLRTGQSTMGYLEITTPTGMHADIASLNTTEANGLFKHVENELQQVNLFFDTPRGLRVPRKFKFLSMTQGSICFDQDGYSHVRDAVIRQSTMIADRAASIAIDRT